MAMPESFRIASFNVESLDAGPDAPTTIEARAAALRPQLRRLEADILCLQEVNAQKAAGQKLRHLEALCRVLEGTGYDGFERAVSLGLKGRGLADHHNLVVLSRWPIRRWRSIRHDLVPPPLARRITARPPDEAPQALEWDRPILHTTIALPWGLELEVVNLHLRAPLATPVPGQRHRPMVWKSAAGWAEGFFVSEIKRSGQALEARLLVDALLDDKPDALVAVCGDFNARDHETPVRIIRGAVEDTGSGTHAGRELISLARSVPPELRYSVLHGGERALYDQLLVSRALYGAFHHFALHNEALADEGTVGADTPFSFHAPLVAEFHASRLAGR
jgi:endonuclease/exonuclease/phosphatase family metal-dependent hydrolase